MTHHDMEDDSDDSTTMWTRTFEWPGQLPCDTRLRVEEQWTDEECGLGGSVWGGGLRLADLVVAGAATNAGKRIAKSFASSAASIETGTGTRTTGWPDVRGKRCLELGAGAAGLPGMACAVVGAHSVVLTDMAGVVPALTATVERNRHVFSEQCRAVDVHALDWADVAVLMRGRDSDCVVASENEMAGAGSDSDSKLDSASASATTASILNGPPFDYVFAGECLYEPAMVDTLLEALRAISSMQGDDTVAQDTQRAYRRTVAFIAGIIGQSTFDHFLQTVGVHFHWKVVETPSNAGGSTAGDLSLLPEVVTGDHVPDPRSIFQLELRGDDTLASTSPPAFPPPPITR